MPEPPSVSLWTRYILEIPWPLGIGLLVAALVVWRMAVRDGVKSRIRVAAGLGVAGVVVLCTGWLVMTSGERARIISTDLVQAVVSKNTQAAGMLLASDCVLTVGAPKNPGLDRQAILQSFDDFAQRFTVQNNTISTLQGYSESSDAATVHMACYTTVDSLPHPNLSRWVLRVQRKSDGRWQITRLTCVSINGRTPSLDMLR